MNDDLTYEDLKRVFEELKPQHATYFIETSPGRITQIRLPFGPERRYRDGTFLVTTDETEAMLRDSVRQESKDKPMFPDLALGYLVRVANREAAEFFCECFRELNPDPFRITRPNPRENPPR